MGNLRPIPGGPRGSMQRQEKLYAYTNFTELDMHNCQLLILEIDKCEGCEAHSTKIHNQASG